MRLRRQRPTAPPRPEIAEELRTFERKLRGWSVGGTETGDLHGLLRRAADEIDRLTAASQSSSDA